MGAVWGNEVLWEKNVGATRGRPPKIFDFRIFLREITHIALRQRILREQNPRATEGRPYDSNDLRLLGIRSDLFCAADIHFSCQNVQIVGIILLQQAGGIQTVGAFCRALAAL